MTDNLLVDPWQEGHTVDTPETVDLATPRPGAGWSPTPPSRHPRRRQAVLAVAATAGVLLALAGCSGEPTDASVNLAQANVSAKEKSLADAESEATAANAAFCGTSSTYITALDRYGDVLNQTAPTVGDVKDAGADLTDPRQETVKAGEDAVTAQENVAKAEQDLADAQETLAAAQAKALGETPKESETTKAPSETPTETPTSVTRVQQAEAEFADAQAGITDETPLRQAAEQFNSAAVALEIAWLQLFAEAGCLTDEQEEQAATAVADYTTALQQSLAEAGYYEGEVDGVYGPETVSAVEDLQKANGLPQTGTVDKATAAALQSELAALGGAAAQQDTATTAAVQQTLKLAGYWNGPIDGQWTEELTAALKEFQTDLGVPATGTVDSATIAAFEDAIASAQTTPTPSPTTTSPKPSPTKPSPTMSPSAKSSSTKPSSAEPSPTNSSSGGA